MTVFDPYDSRQQPPPTTTRVSTMSQVPLGDGSVRRRSGLLSALAVFLGWGSLGVAVVLAFAGLAARALCVEGRLTGQACEVGTQALWLVPAGVAVLGVVLSWIGGSLARRRRSAAGLAMLLVVVAVIALAVSWFTTTTGLPLI